MRLNECVSDPWKKTSSNPSPSLLFGLRVVNLSFQRGETGLLNLLLKKDEEKEKEKENEKEKIRVSLAVEYPNGIVVIFVIDWKEIVKKMVYPNPKNGLMGVGLYDYVQRLFQELYGHNLSFSKCSPLVLSPMKTILVACTPKGVDSKQMTVRR